MSYLTKVKSYLKPGSLNPFSLFYYRKPAPMDFGEKKEKEIVVVGAGVIGLTTAYYLSKNPHNRITVIEKNTKPYQETSL